MSKSFLLRYQEEHVAVDVPGAGFTTTRTKVGGESADQSAYCATTLPQAAIIANDTFTYTFVHDEAPRNDDHHRPLMDVVPLRDTTTKTGVPSEQADPSASAEFCSALPGRQAILAAETMTATAISAEAPRNDDHRRRTAVVFPTCS